MEKEEAYRRLDQYDFSKLLINLYWCQGLDDVEKLRRMVPLENINDDGLGWAVNSLNDDEFKRYFETRYRLKFKKNVSYSIVLLNRSNGVPFKRV